MVGVVLAGGAGRRMGGAKPGRMLAGRPLAAYPAAALQEVCERVALVAKAGVELPLLRGVERWDEPAEPQHPLTGIVHALERAGEPLLVCAADMPFVTGAALRELAAEHERSSAPATVAVAAGVMQPLLGAYAPAALATLRAAPPGARLTATVDGLDPARVEVAVQVARSVDTQEQLRAAERLLQ